MEYIIEYTNERERSSIIENNSDKILRGEQNLKTGNFLVFEKPTDEELNLIAIKDILETSNFTLLDIQLGIYEEILNLSETIKNPIEGGE